MKLWLLFSPTERELCSLSEQVCAGEEAAATFQCPGSWRCSVQTLSSALCAEQAWLSNTCLCWQEEKLRCDDSLFPREKRAPLRLLSEDLLSDVSPRHIFIVESLEFPIKPTNTMWWHFLVEWVLIQSALHVLTHSGKDGVSSLHHCAFYLDSREAVKGGGTTAWQRVDFSDI